MVVELKVVLKDSEKTHSKKFLCYDPVTLDEDNQYIKDIVLETATGFEGEAEDVKVKASLTIPQGLRRAS